MGTPKPSGAVGCTSEAFTFASVVKTMGAPREISEFWGSASRGDADPPREYYRVRNSCQYFGPTFPTYLTVIYIKYASEWY